MKTFAKEFAINVIASLLWVFALVRFGNFEVFQIGLALLLICNIGWVIGQRMLHNLRTERVETLRRRELVLKTKQLIREDKGWGTGAKVLRSAREENARWLADWESKLSG